MNDRYYDTTGIMLLWTASHSTKGVMGFPEVLASWGPDPRDHTRLAEYRLWGTPHEVRAVWIH